MDGIDVGGWRSRGVAVTNCPEAVSDATADLAVALALAASRRLVEGVEVVGGGDWSRWRGLGVDLSGAVVGIVGMGNIGIKIARRMAGFDCQVSLSFVWIAVCPRLNCCLCVRMCVRVCALVFATLFRSASIFSSLPFRFYHNCHQQHHRRLCLIQI